LARTSWPVPITKSFKAGTGLNLLGFKIQA